MSAIVATVAAGIAASIIVVRCICILYHTHWSRHPRHVGHWMGFGYSYVALAAGAVCGVLAVATGDLGVAQLAVGLFLGASAGLIAFDRRADVCGRARHCSRRIEP